MVTLRFAISLRQIGYAGQHNRPAILLLVSRRISRSAAGTCSIEGCHYPDEPPFDCSAALAGNAVMLVTMRRCSPSLEPRMYAAILTQTPGESPPGSGRSPPSLKCERLP